MSIKITKEDIRNALYKAIPATEINQDIINNAILSATEKASDKEFAALIEHLNLIMLMDLKPILCICNTVKESGFVEGSLRRCFGQEIDCVMYANYEEYVKHPKDYMEFDIWNKQPQYIVIVANMDEEYKTYLKQCTSIPLYFYEDKVTKTWFG